MDNRRALLWETLSVVLGLLGLTLVFVALIAFYVANSWSGAWVLAPLVAGGVLLAASGIFNWRVMSVVVGIAALGTIVIVLITKGANRYVTEPRYLTPVIIAGIVLVLSLLVNGILFVITITSRRGLIGMNVVAMIILSIVIVGIVNWFGSRHHKRFDMTKVSRFALCDKTQSILRGLKQKLIITTFFQPGDPLFGMVENLLDRYKLENPGRVTVVHVNPLKDRLKVQEFAKRTKQETLELGSTVFESGDRIKVVSRGDLLKYDFSMYGQGREAPKFKGEEAFTSAVQDVSNPKQQTVYFLTGHGEKSPEDYDQEVGLSSLRDELKRNNYATKTLTFDPRKGVSAPIPADCDLLVIAGPQKRYQPEEIERIRGYINENKPVFICLDPTIQTEGAEESGLESLLAEYGVEVRRDVVIAEVVQTLFGGAQADVRVPVSSYQSHPITKGMKRITSMFVYACMVGPAPQPPRPTIAVDSLIKTSENSWGETRLDSKDEKKHGYNEGEDVKGPVSLAVVVSPKAPTPPNPYMPPPPDMPKPEGPKMVVIGDSDFLANALLEAVPGNANIFLNSISWLAGKETEIGIEPKTIVDAKITLTADQQKATFWICVVGLPYLALLMGGIVWWRRRR